MRTYRVYFLARGDEVVGSQSFNAEDDRAAKAIAEECAAITPAVRRWRFGTAAGRCTGTCAPQARETPNNVSGGGGLAAEA